jgi:hypothetical protein
MAKNATRAPSLHPCAPRIRPAIKFSGACGAVRCASPAWGEVTIQQLALAQPLACSASGLYHPGASQHTAQKSRAPNTDTRGPGEGQLQLPKGRLHTSKSGSDSGISPLLCLLVGGCCGVKVTLERMMCKRQHSSRTGSRQHHPRSCRKPQHWYHGNPPHKTQSDL